MTPLEAAIFHTVLYADVFDFPVTTAEIHHFLIYDRPTTQQAVTDTLEKSPWLRELLVWKDGYIACAQRANLIHQRKQREVASARLWPQAVRYGRWLSRLPYVRMVAITGALAMRNAATDRDDLDYLLVTAPGRVWLARAFAIALVRFARLGGVVICPNYVLAENVLEQERKDLFIAHEIAQMIPVYGHEIYRRFREVNRWAGDSLPNARGAFHPVQDTSMGRVWTLLKRLLEALFNQEIGHRLETWEYQRKLAQFAPDMQRPDSAAQLDERRVKGHFHDYGAPVLRKYQQRLREYGLAEDALVATGD